MGSAWHLQGGCISTPAITLAAISLASVVVPEQPQPPRSPDRPPDQFPPSAFPEAKPQRASRTTFPWQVWSMSLRPGLLMAPEHLRTKAWTVLTRFPQPCVCFQPGHFPTCSPAILAPSCPHLSVPCPFPPLFVMAPPSGQTTVSQGASSLPVQLAHPAWKGPPSPLQWSPSPTLCPTFVCSPLHYWEGPVSTVTLPCWAAHTLFVHSCTHPPDPSSQPQTFSVCLLTALLINNIPVGFRCTKVCPQAKDSAEAIYLSCDLF